jgi:hypothetical protein
MVSLATNADLMADLYFYFLALIVGITYYNHSDSEPDFIFRKLFPNRVVYSTTVGATFLYCTFFNTLFQVYCQPVAWAQVALVLLFVFLTTEPFWPNTKLARVGKGIGWAMAGVVGLYLLLFATLRDSAGLYSFFILFYTAFALIMAIPIYYLGRISRVPEFLYFFYWWIVFPFLCFGLSVWYVLKKQSDYSRTAFFSTLLFLALLVGFSTYQIKTIRQALNENTEKAVQQYLSNPVGRFYLERALYADKKYLTLAVIGLDPLLGAAVMLLPKNRSGLLPHLNLDQETVYKRAFPENPSEFYDCRCGEYERVFQEE